MIPLYLNSFLFILLCSGTVVPMLLAVMAVVPIDKIAVHFHDTYGQSLPNILVSLQVSHQLNIAWPLDMLVFWCVKNDFILLVLFWHST